MVIKDWRMPGASLMTHRVCLQQAYNAREWNWKKYDFIVPTYYVASKVFSMTYLIFSIHLGRQNKIFDYNQQIRLQPTNKYGRGVG